MKILLACLGLLVLLGLTACTSPEIKNTDEALIDWPVYKEKLNQINQWTINGRISVQTEDDGGQADYVWQQHNQSEYNIRLQGPMGIGTTIVNANAFGVNLITSSGTELFDTDVDQLMLRLNGWPLPVSGLYYWLRGLPTPNSSYDISQWNDRGLPRVLFQDGWRIEFKKYKSHNSFLLPGKLFITRVTGEEVEVRLIIRQWSMDELALGAQG